jgi:hypothetical protein
VAILIAISAAGEALAWFSLTLEHLKIRKKHALRKILPHRANRHEATFIQNLRKTSSLENRAPGRNLGLKYTLMGTIFKNFHMKTILKLKINLIRNILNFVSIQ